MTTFTLMPAVTWPALPDGLDGAVVELSVCPDGASVTAEIRIPGPASR